MNRFNFGVFIYLFGGQNYESERTIISSSRRDARDERKCKECATRQGEM